MLVKLTLGHGKHFSVESFTWFDSTLSKIHNCNQFQHHFMSRFCANIISTQKLQSQISMTEKLYGTRVQKLLVKCW